MQRTETRGKRGLLHGVKLPMKLYLFEHCSLCFRVRMTAALKRVHLQEACVLDDDTETMVGLVGKRQIPILVKDDGEPMLESMDMVKFIDGHGEPVLSGPERSEIGVGRNRWCRKQRRSLGRVIRCWLSRSSAPSPRSTITICASSK